MDDSASPRGTHVHLYFSPWLHESRAWRAGRAALDCGLASTVDYIGHAQASLPIVEERGPGETVRRVGRPPALPGAARLARALALPAWWHATLRDTNLRAPASLVIAHSLASLPLGALIKFRSGTRLLYDAHELESEREGWSWWMRKVARIVEATLIRYCDHTIVVNDSIGDWYRAAYPGLSVSTVRNVPTSVAHRGESTLRKDIGVDEGAVVVAYAGAFTRGRGLETAVEAFSKLGGDKHLVMIGYGPMAADLATLAATSSNIHFRPPVEHNQVVPYLRGADVGICQPNGTSLSYHFGLPNKLFEYAAAGLAVIVGQGPEFRAFANESGLGWSIPHDVNSLASTIGPLTRASIKERVARSTYRPPTWDDEKQKLLAALRSASGDLGRAGEIR